ncbi:MAG: efflux RND transporter periplasmic adaptor subunit, partial [Rhodoferax sp.]|nr:efflux RND transporter periplasmic adaptor subunit [Rhodoferax sp.]
DPRQMLVDYRLPERDGPKVKPGQRVQVTLDALPGQTFVAMVEAVDPLLDANGRSLAVRAVIPAAAKGGTRGAVKTTLRSGMFARVSTIFSINAAALVVPESAIVPQGGKQFVIKLMPADAGAKLGPEVNWVSQRQEVKLGVRRQGMVEITDGVAFGDTVVVAGQQRLQKDGSPVRVVELGRAAGKPAGAASAAAAAAPASR